MKNVFIEGIQGMGKSTLLNSICAAVPAFRVCREGDYSPVDLAWCAWLSGEEYVRVLQSFKPLHDEIIQNTVQEQDHYIVTYTKIRTDVPGFYQELEKFEIYNGRKNLQDLKNLILARYRNFTGTDYLFECAFFQNIIEDLILFHQLKDDEIVDFYRELFDAVDKDQFVLLYLHSDGVEDSLRTIKKERCDPQGNEAWYQMMLDYLVHSPYGREHGYAGFEDMIAHFRHRQQLEMRIIREVLGDRAMILQAKNWKIDEIKALIE